MNHSKAVQIAFANCKPPGDNFFPGAGNFIISENKNPGSPGIYHGPVDGFFAGFARKTIGILCA